jgi:hypothetical protein
MRYGDVRHSEVLRTLTVPHTLEKGYNNSDDAQFIPKISNARSGVREQVQGWIT